MNQRFEDCNSIIVISNNLAGEYHFKNSIFNDSDNQKKKKL